VKHSQSVRLAKLFDEKAALLSQMGNEHRLNILMLLRGGENTISSLVETTGVTQSAISRHVAQLRKGKLVKTRRESGKIHYSCTSSAVLRVLDTLDEIYNSANDTATATRLGRSRE
jgi:DNA-binding transcriptional ArsR family regulator